MINILEKSKVLLTGANGGIGTAFISELIDRNVDKIYITGMDIEVLKQISDNLSNRKIG